MRLLLGCSPITTEECLGFTGDCADLPEQFPGLNPELDDFECTEFPNSDLWSDRLITSLIMTVRGLSWLWESGMIPACGGTQHRINLFSCYRHCSC